VFKVSPRGKLPVPNKDDYKKTNPITYEGDFYQELEDDRMTETLIYLWVVSRISRAMHKMVVRQL
jgi:hypothetical protein